MRRIVLVLTLGTIALAARATAAPHEPAERLIGAALVDDTGWRRLEYLSDRIGKRLSGSAALDAAIAWAASEMRADGLDSVRTEKAMVPCWVRGQESASLVEPVARPLSMLGLGGSVGTVGSEGLTADVEVARDWDELDALGTSVKGKIVLLNARFTSYGETVPYRTQGASRAAKLGAVAVLVRSIGPVSLRTPHTGAVNYNPEVPTKIPAAAITIEDAETIARLRLHGTVKVHLQMSARMLPDVESANVVAEIRGRELPNEIVLVGGHLDSWDVGTGSTDDGGGCLAAWEAVRLMKRLGLRPRRTVRVVLFTNEENGTRGALAYRDAHRNELKDHLLAIESDSGVTRPSGFGLSKAAPAGVRKAIQEIATLLRGIGADRIDGDGGGADIGPLMKEGVPGMALNVDSSRYFDIHHTEADTFDKIDRTNFSLCVATMAVMAYEVAERKERLR